MRTVFRIRTGGYVTLITETTAIETGGTRQLLDSGGTIEVELEDGSRMSAEITSVTHLPKVSTP